MPKPQAMTPYHSFLFLSRRTDRLLRYLSVTATTILMTRFVLPSPSIEAKILLLERQVTKPEYLELRLPRKALVEKLRSPSPSIEAKLLMIRSLATKEKHSSLPTEAI